MNDQFDQLGSASRALLDAARDGLTPDAQSIARVRSKVDVAVGAATGGGLAGALASKLGVLVIAVGIVTGTALLLRRDNTPVEPAPLALAPITESATPTRHTAREPSVPGRSSIAMPPMDVSSAPAKLVEAPPRAKSAAKPRAIELRREVQLIDAAMAAMRRGDPAAALVSVRTHAVETAGAGQLAEDAEAIEIEALCRLRDPGVAAKLAAFDARWPDSAQRSGLTTSCR